jgi:hypothetical protein
MAGEGRPPSLLTQANCVRLRVYGPWRPRCSSSSPLAATLLLSLGRRLASSAVSCRLVPVLDRVDLAGGAASTG